MAVAKIRHISYIEKNKKGVKEMAKRIIRHAKRNKLMWKLILFVIVLIGSAAVLFDSLQTHQQYKDSRLVDAKVVDIAGRDNGIIKVTYKYKVGKEAERN